MAGLAGLVAAGFWTASVAERSRELDVNRIRIEGNDRLAKGEVLDALGIRPGSNILTLDLERLKRRMLESTWVKDVELSRDLPATLTLRVVERVPVGIAALERLYLMDEDGVMLDEMGPSYSELALPVVRGLRTSDGRLVTERAELAGRVLATLATDERLERVVSELDVREGDDSIRVRLREPAITILASEKNLLARLVEVVPLANDLLQRFPEVVAIDARFEDRVYLQRVEAWNSQAVDVEDTSTSAFATGGR